MKITLLCLVTLLSPLRGAEMVPSQVPASAKWFFHVDFDQMRGTATGKSVIAEIESDHGARLRAFKRMFSLHPLEDLHGVTLYGDGKPKQAVALLHGTFDRAHMEDVVKGADDYSSSDYGGFTVHSWKDKGEKHHASFVHEKLLLFSRQKKLLHLAIDTLNANVPVEAAPFFAGAGGKPLIAASARLSEIEVPNERAHVAKMAESFHLAANENEGRFFLRAEMKTETPQKAERLRRMIDGLLAFAQVGDPKLDGLDLRSEIIAPPNEPRLNASLSLPVDQWISLMEQKAEEKEKKHH